MKPWVSQGRLRKLRSSIRREWEQTREKLARVPGDLERGGACAVLAAIG